MAGVLKSMIYSVDCRVDEQLDNNFLTLNLWGKPIFLYIIEELFRLKSSSQIYVLTDSEEIKKLYTKFYRGGGTICNSSSGCKTCLYGIRKSRFAKTLYNRKSYKKL